MDNIKIKPLFKYIGGKSWLRAELRYLVEKIFENNKYNSYCEPFVGGLGSFLNIYDILLKNNIKNVILSDINEILISTYNYIKESPEKIISEFLIIENEFVLSVDIRWKNTKDKQEIKQYLKLSEIYFNKIKKLFNENKSNINEKQSARLIFLQKHSFNGIYRENSKGEYNTPFNWSGNNMLDSIEDKIKEMNLLFNKFNIQFLAQSFEQIKYNKNTLYYLDPPYLNEEIGENKYNKNDFSIDKQLFLINQIKNTNFIYSNHAAEVLLNEFRNIENINIKKINRKNIISANSKTRNNDKIEVLVSSTN